MGCTLTLSATKQLQKRFWDGFCGALPSKTTRGLRCEKWDSNMGHAINLRTGSNYELTLRFNVRDRRIEADLTLNGPSAKRNVSELHERFYEPSKAALGADVEWLPEVTRRPNYPGKRHPEAHVRIKRAVDPHAEADWPSYWDWLVVRAAALDEWRSAVGVS